MLVQCVLSAREECLATTSGKARVNPQETQRCKLAEVQTEGCLEEKDQQAERELCCLKPYCP